MRHETRLLSQVHPQFVQQVQPSSQVFRPTPKDEKLLSVYDGDQIGPGDAFEHYTNQIGLSSIGIMAVTVGECETCELQSRPDPEAFPEHAVIDFGEYGEKETKKKAKQYRNYHVREYADGRIEMIPQELVDVSVRNVQRSWATEAEDRIEAYRRGDLSAVDGLSGLKELRSRYRA